MENIHFYADLTNTLWGNYGFQVLFYLSLVLIFIFEQKRIRKAGSAWYSICILLIIYNPVMYILCKYIFSSGDLRAYYCRLFCLVPIVFVIAYALTLVIKQLSGWKKMCCLFIVLFIIAICGHSPYGETWFVKAVNVNKVPEDVRQICMIFQDYEGVITIMVPPDLTAYMRQMDSNFSMPYGRNENFDISNQLQSETPDVPYVLNYAVSTGTNFVVALNIEEAISKYLLWGCEIEGVTDRYVVLRQHYIPN